MDAKINIFTDELTISFSAVLTDAMSESGKRFNSLTLDTMSMPLEEISQEYIMGIESKLQTTMSKIIPIVDEKDILVSTKELDIPYSIMDLLKDKLVNGEGKPFGSFKEYAEYRLRNARTMKYSTKLTHKYEGMDVGLNLLLIKSSVVYRTSNNDMYETMGTPLTLLTSMNKNNHADGMIDPYMRRIMSNAIISLINGAEEKYGTRYYNKPSCKFTGVSFSIGSGPDTYMITINLLFKNISVFRLRLGTVYILKNDVTNDSKGLIDGSKYGSLRLENYISTLFIDKTREICDPLKNMSTLHKKLMKYHKSTNSFSEFSIPKKSLNLNSLTLDELINERRIFDIDGEDNVIIADIETLKESTVSTIINQISKVASRCLTKCI